MIIVKNNLIVNNIMYKRNIKKRFRSVSNTVEKIGRIRWEISVFGIIGIVIIASYLSYYIEVSTRFLNEISNLGSNLTYFATIILLANSIALIIIGFTRKRYTPIYECEKKSIKPSRFFALIYGLIGMFITAIFTIIAIENGYHGIMEGDTGLVTIEAFHIPMFIISFIQFFIIILVSRRII